MANYGVHGKDTRVVIGGVPMKLRKWGVKHTIPKVVLTNTESGGKQELLDGGGVEKCEGDFEAVYDPSKTAADPPAIAPGVILPIEYWIKGVKRYGFDAYFEEAEITGEPDGDDPIVYKATVHSTGNIVKG